MPETNVIFWQRLKGAKRQTKHDYICFSPLKDTAVQVTYECKTNLNQEVIDFYIDFIKGFLEPSRITHKMVKSRGCVVFKTNTKGLSRPQSLLYLTAQRYLNETPEIVEALYEYRGEALEEQFKQFQLIHWKIHKREMKLRYNNMSGHALIYDYSWGYAKAIKDVKTITVAKFKENFTTKDTNVQGYFK